MASKSKSEWLNMMSPPVILNWKDEITQLESIPNTKSDAMLNQLVGMQISGLERSTVQYDEIEINEIRVGG